jgi:hypothetical protein
MNEVKQRLEWVQSWISSCDKPDPYCETWMSMLAILSDEELIRFHKRASMYSAKVQHPGPSAGGAHRPGDPEPPLIRGAGQEAAPQATVPAV